MRKEQKTVSGSEKRVQRIEKFGIYAVALILLPVGMLVSRNFLSLSNLLNIFDAVSFLGIMTAGMALVTYCGKLVDMSTPSTVAVGGFISILTLRWGIAPMLICVLLSGAAIGAVNGLIISHLRLNTVVWTLAMSFLFSGLVRVVFGSSTVYPSQGDTTFFEGISRYRIGGVVPVSILVMLLIYVALHIVVEYTKFGAQMKLVGYSDSVARYSGIPVERVVFISFVCSGTLAAVTGLFIASLSRAACYNFGSGYDFKAITAIVLSGMLLDGGKGSMIGVLGGVLTIGLMNNIMTLMGLNTFLQDVVTGAIFILVIWATNYSSKKLEARYA